MANAPVFDAPTCSIRAASRLADLDGSGTTDVLYLGRTRSLLLDQPGGQRLSAARAPRARLPPTAARRASSSSISSGSRHVVPRLVLAAAADGRAAAYIDLMGGETATARRGRPTTWAQTTRIAYASSTAFYLDGPGRGRPWTTRLPFPVHVVAGSTTIDDVSGARLVTPLSLSPRLLRRRRARVPRIRRGRAARQRDRVRPSAGSSAAGSHRRLGSTPAHGPTTARSAPAGQRYFQGARDLADSLVEGAASPREARNTVRCAGRCCARRSMRSTARPIRTSPMW